MKRSSTFLHQLIHSLSPAEKRHFRVWAKQQGKGSKQNYLLLFDAIDKQAEYNEEKLKAKFQKAAFIHYLSTAKSQLKDQILEALHQYHSSNTTAEQLKKQLHQIRLLSDRGFVEQAAKLLTQTSKAIQKAGLDYLLVEALQVKQELFSRLFPIKLESIDPVAEEAQQLIETLGIQFEQWRLLHELYSHYFRQMNPRSAEQMAPYRSIEEHAFFSALPAEATPHSQIEHAHMMARYHSILGNKETAQQAFRKALDGYAAYPALKEQQTSRYINLLNNYLMECSSRRDYGPFEQGVEELNSLAKAPKLSRLHKAQAFAFSHILQCERLWREREFDQLLPILPQIESGLNEHEGLIQPQYVLLLNNALFNTYFIMEQYEAAMTWMEKTLADRKLESFQGVQAIARIWNLMVHYELDNWLLLDSILVSSKRYFQNRSIYFDAERQFIQSIQKVIHLPEGQPRKTAFRTLHEHLSVLKENEFEKQLFHYFSLLEWVESQFSGIPFREILQQQKPGASNVKKTGHPEG
ncbi:MAG: hypothetical protein AAF598_03140 [Bacteroidota bacterium]